MATVTITFPVIAAGRSAWQLTNWPLQVRAVAKLREEVIFLAHLVENTHYIPF
jgi:hypothetical protein